MAKGNNTQQNININVETNADKAKVKVDGLGESTESLGKSSEEAEKKVKDLNEQLDKSGKEARKVDENFSSFSTAVRGAAIATQGIVSGLALIGVEGDKVAETLLQVQAAMAFADSISQITEMGSELMDLKSQVSGVFTTLTTATKSQTTAQGILNAVMAANPVGAVVVAVTLLVAALAALGYGVYKLTEYFKDNNDSSDKLRDTSERLTKEIELQNEEIAKGREGREKKLSHEYEMAKASGLSAEALRDLRLAMIDARTEEEKYNKEKAYSIYLEAERLVSQAKSSDASKKAIEELTAVREAAYENYIALDDAYYESYQTRVEEEESQLVEVRQELTNHNIKIAEERKAAAERDLEERTRQREEELEAIKENAEELQEIQDEIESDRLKAKEKKREEELEAEKNFLVNKAILLQENIDREKAAEEARVETKKELEKQKGDLAWQGLDLIKEVFAENVAVQKAALIIENAAAIANIAISTSKAVGKSIAASPLTGGMPFSGIAIASGVMGIASTIAATVKGLKSMGGGSVEGGSESISAGPTGPQMAASSGPQVDFQAPGSSQVGNSVSQARGEVPPVKAYVVSKDMTNQQEADRYMRESNTI